MKIYGILMIAALILFPIPRTIAQTAPPQPAQAAPQQPPQAPPQQPPQTLPPQPAQTPPQQPAQTLPPQPAQTTPPQHAPVVPSQTTAPIVAPTAPAPIAPVPKEGLEAKPLNAPHAFVLEDGTPLKLRLNRTLSSADAKVGEQVDFEVLEEVRVGDVIVIPKGGLAWGTVTEAEAKKRMGRGGKLDVNIDAVRLMSGDRVALRAVKGGSGGGHVGAMTGGIVATSIVFFPAAPLFLFMHGKDITIPKGTEVAAYVSGNANLDPVKFVQASAQPAPTVQSPADQLISGSSVIVKSTPDGAEITIDGKFVGSTPSTVKLAPGDHEIIVQKTGFKSWKRTMAVGAGSSVTLDATLEKEP